MPRTAIIYIHPELGEMYIDRNSQAFEYFKEKKLGQLDRHLLALCKK